MRVIAVAVVSPQGLLLVSKRAAPDVFYLPGGKPEAGEAPAETLARELREELGVGLLAVRAWRDVEAPAALEGVPMRMTVFRGELDGDPAPAAEIAALRHWPADAPLTLAPAIERDVIPALRAEGVL